MVGLGNPGIQYALSRHNVGFRTLDLMADRLAVKYRKPWFKHYLLARAFVDTGPIPKIRDSLSLVKPLTYMNRSGAIFPGLLSKTTRDRILVVCDTLDLPSGQCRLKRKGSSAGHRGLESIIQRIGSETFMRLYIGIGRPLDRSDTISYVLDVPGPEQEILIASGIEAAVKGILMLLRENPERVMNVLNSKTV